VTKRAPQKQEVEVPPVEAAPEPEKPKLSTKEKLKRAKLPTRDVEICLSTDLQKQYEALHEQLAEAYTREKGDKRLGQVSESKRIARQIEDLQAEMREYTIVFRIRSLGRRWQELVDQHPPREGVAEDVYLGFNPDTFFDAAIRACTVEPDDLDDEDWADLLGTDKTDGKLTAAQYRELQDAVMAMNVRRIDVPNSLAASRILRASEPE
jgi:hypothetical protein